MSIPEPPERLIGRDPEKRQLERFLGQVNSKGDALLIRGEAGIGSTRSGS
jgi:hypothetical protein